MDSELGMASTLPQRWSWLRVMCGAIVALGGAAVAGWFYLRSGSAVEDISSPRTPPGTISAEESPQSSADRRYREALIGSWQRPDYFGDTTLTLNSDGTGQMHIVFSTVYSYLVDDTLDMEICWQVREGRCVFDSIRGEPVEAFNMVTKLKGSRRDWKIVEVTQEQAVFLDDIHQRGEKTWRRGNGR